MMPIKKIDAYVLSPKQMFWISLAVIVAVLPHLPRLPVWFPLLLILVVASRWLSAIKKLKPMPGLMVVVITMFIFLAIIYFQGLSLNREISVTILTTMTVLKLLETWRKRDAWMVVMLCYFVILTRFFYSQDMLLVVYLLASVIVITHTLFVLQHDNTKGYLQTREIKQTLGLLLAGMPLAVLFFLFFPRLGTPIWGSPDFFGEGRTGMSEEMSPGSISQLFHDDSTAFRVTFAGDIPANSQLYWRGPVLWDFDGFTWMRNKDLSATHRLPIFNNSGNKFSYEVELEPTGQHHLFALDYILHAPDAASLLDDLQLMSSVKINQLKHYQATSVLTQYSPYVPLSTQVINRLTSLPAGFNQKTIKLMRQWQAQNLSPKQLINKALHWFTTDEFYYSYSPPLLHGDTVDQFLFETKSGFCEHYASAFTVMMRAAGLPARVVTGYQGGILNEGYLLVKQSDAHAWSEVWIADKGWLRVDPTAAVSPLRVEHGSQALMSENARNWLDSSWYRKLGEKYDGMRHKWNKWVRDYSVVKQKALFQVLGFDSQDGKSIAIVMGLIMLITTILVLWFLYITRVQRALAPYDKIFQKFIRVFKQRGLIRTDDQGITTFATIASKQFPQVQNSIDEFTQLYLKLRFSKYAKEQRLLDKRLDKLVAKISQDISLYQD
ncbi:FIG001454: Transglutaminase-like enzymes, putative cysteine proteases [hydrothermal vent metagenome]|uniref:FIG001454: Transglutaminase-like enzymes, putative cysteine proteases n=1 Tax=hydrothermal vent metagenome TaxID=652676 RepID=A0A3B0VYU4_9ZZZZ